MAQITWKAKEVIEAENFTAATNSKIEELKAACTQAIYDGFTSLSTGYEFGFNDHDQSNFTQQTVLIVAAGGPANYTGVIKWKTKSDSVVDLTVTEFLSIIEEAKDHKIQQQTKYWQLEYQVLNAKSIEEIQAIKW